MIVVLCYVVPVLCVDILANVLAMGFPIKNIYHDSIISKLDLYQTKQKCIITSDGYPFIGKPGSSLFFSYYIQDIGLVWRFSKLHFAIKSKFDSLPFDDDSYKIEDFLS